jgi:hypothetical protein
LYNVWITHFLSTFYSPFFRNFLLYFVITHFSLWHSFLIMTLISHYDTHFSLWHNTFL